MSFLEPERRRLGLSLKQAAEDYVEVDFLPSTRSELAVPMLRGERVLGVLDVQSDAVDGFSDLLVRQVERLAPLVGVAIENARALAHLEERNRHLQLSEAVSRIAVGATDLNSDRASYSNQGAELELMAPGGDLTADADGDGLRDGILQETIYEGEFYYMLAEGTSMAAPHVSALAAMMYGTGMESPTDIRKALVLTAHDLGDRGRDTAYGWGIINPVAAIAWNAPLDNAEDIELDQISAIPLDEGHALISWVTDVEASTLIEGDNGYAFMDTSPLVVHRAYAQGESGTTVEFTLTSRSPDNAYYGESTLQVTFD